MYNASATLRQPSAAITEQLLSLTRHLQECQAARSWLFQAAVWAETAHGLVAPRFITTVSVAAGLLLLFTW